MLQVAKRLHMTKAELRMIYREKRKLLSDEQQQLLNQQMLLHFSTIHFPTLHRVLSFCKHPLRAEPDTFIFTNWLQQQFPEITVAYPVVEWEPGQMKAVVSAIDPPFPLSQWGIPEPVGEEVWLPNTIDLILVPLLVADAKGNRVGYGGGYYDRYLANTRSDSLKIGIGFFDIIDSISDTAEFDVPLDGCITPVGYYEF